MANSLQILFVLADCLRNTISRGWNRLPWPLNCVSPTGKTLCSPYDEEDVSRSNVRVIDMFPNYLLDWPPCRIREGNAPCSMKFIIHKVITLSKSAIHINNALVSCDSYPPGPESSSPYPRGHSLHLLLTAVSDLSRIHSLRLQASHRIPFPASSVSLHTKSPLKRIHVSIIEPFSP